MIIPKVFISYSHDTLEHKKWVLELATRLRNNGIDAILDQFELQPGDDVPHFMETHLASANKILMICTEKYVQKANEGQGGVGYEKMIITSNLMKSIDENKIIPIIRQIGSTNVPTFLKSKLYINFSKEDDFEFSYDDLVRTIHNSPLFVKPPVGNNPFAPIARAKLDENVKLLDTLLATILFLQGTKNSVMSDKIISALNISAVLFKISMKKLMELGYAEFHGSGHGWVCATEKGLMYAYENKIAT
jgi:predicted transcriptional regulator